MALGMTVKQVLNSMDSVEYTRWMAYEKVYGELGGSRWQQETDASIHEQLQRLAFILSQAHFTGEGRDRGPVDPPIRYPRPFDLDEDERVAAADVEADYSAEWLPPEQGDERCDEDCTCKGGTNKKSKYHF